MMNEIYELNYLVTFRFYDRQEKVFSPVKDFFITTDKGFYYASAIARHRVGDYVFREKVHSNRRYVAQIISITVMDFENNFADNILINNK